MWQCCVPASWRHRGVSNGRMYHRAPKCDSCSCGQPRWHASPLKELSLVKLSLLAKWLARKTPLRKPNRGEWIISIKPRPKRAYDCVGLFILLLFYCMIFVFSQALCDTFPTSMAWYSLCVLKVLMIEIAYYVKHQLTNFCCDILDLTELSELFIKVLQVAFLVKNQ